MKETVVPKISVIMAVHNGERYLEESVRSLLEQTFTDFELIIVDDGSTDQTAELLTRLGQEEARIRVIRQPKQGQTAALLKGIAESRGEYLARQDADDRSFPLRLEEQIRYLESHPHVALVGSAADLIDEEGKVVGTVPTCHGTARVRQELRTLKATMVHSSVLMRRQAYEAVGGYRVAFLLSQDFDLWSRMMERYDVDILPQRLIQWRINRKGVYVNQRVLQLKYGAIAITFAKERIRFGSDSYSLLAESKGDLDQFISGYRLRGAVQALWGESLYRTLGDPVLARTHLKQAVAGGYLSPRTVGLLGWSLTGLGWPGRPQLSL